MASVPQLETSDKLLLIVAWRKSDRQDMFVYGALCIVGLAVAIFGPNLPQLTGLKHAETVSALLGVASVPKSAGQVWKRFKSVQVLTFLTQAYSQNVAVAHADNVFQRRLSLEIPS